MLVEAQTPTLLELLPGIESFNLQVLDPHALTLQATARGQVRTKKSGPKGVRIEQIGTWQSGPQTGQSCNVTYIWKLNQNDELKVLRVNSQTKENEPIAHFDFTEEKAPWHSPVFTCGHDDYSGELTYQQNTLTLGWTVQGPRKNFRLIFHYRLKPAETTAE